MARSLLADAFAHHAWATLRLIDTCLPLSREQLETAVPGTYGAILDTMRHLVGADSWYLFDLTRDGARRIEEGQMDLRELKAAMEADATAWLDLLALDPDPEDVVKEVDENDGFERDASVGVRLAQALHHGTDHRSQICTALTTLGIQPPSIDVWDFGVATGRIVEALPDDSKPSASDSS
jgi:uncharacterized damage-inducible protein DinB